MKTEDIKKMAQAWNTVQEASYGKKKTEASDTQMGTITVKTDAERKARAQAYRDKKAKNEELKGNQHKIDHNKDGKISAADFKGLRKKTKKDQEVEVQTSESTELDEISKKTLGSYVKKASSDMANNAYALGARDPQKKPGSWDKAFKRKAGIAKATDKLTKEEIELDEVLDTPKAMDSYRNKAKYSKERAANSAAAKMLRNKNGFHSTDTSQELDTMDKRTKGLKMADRAAARKYRQSLRKEEIGLDEVSMDLAKKVAKKRDEKGDAFRNKAGIMSYGSDAAKSAMDNARKNWNKADKTKAMIAKRKANEAVDHGNMNNGSPAGEGLSPSAKDQLAKKTPAPSDAFDANVVNKKTFDAMRASAKKAPMRTNDNAQGDKTPPKGK